jgi:hypothetical protein
MDCVSSILSHLEYMIIRKKISMYYSVWDLAQKPYSLMIWWISLLIFNSFDSVQKASILQ